MIDPDLAKDLTAMQLQIAKTTHALCDVLDSSRKLSQRLRMALLVKLEGDLIKHRKRVDAIRELPHGTKLKPIREIMKAIKNVQM